MIFIGPKADYVFETNDFCVKSDSIRIYSSTYPIHEEDFVGILNAVKNGNKFYQFKYKCL